MLKGFLGLFTAQDLFEKLRSDYDVFCANPKDSYKAFNFFVTAEHIPDWIGNAGIKYKEPYLRINSHLLSIFLEVTMRKTTTIIISTLFLLQGCAGSLTKQPKSPNVTSNPSGAVVYANALEIGKTPLRRNLYDDFPAGWQNSIYQAQGVLIVKKDGCKDYTLKINDQILREPIHAELKCSKASKAETSTPVAASQNGTEVRLKKLEALYKKGLVTKEEYIKTRERILSEL